MLLLLSFLPLLQGDPASAEHVFVRGEPRVLLAPEHVATFDSQTSFTVSVEIRTHDAGFCTPLMCRDGEEVHYSLVIGRRPGTISFEAWSWQRDRAISARRIDDGAWHRIEACHDAGAGVLALFVDGALEALAPVRAAFAPKGRPALRLGNNIGADQPFSGALRGLSVRAGLGQRAREVLATVRDTTVLSAAAVDEALLGWLHRHAAPQPPRAASAAEWTQRAEQVQSWVQRALGLVPPPYAPSGATGVPTDFAHLEPTLDLDVQKGGELVRQGYRVQRVYWQAFEGYYAAGFLYLPASPDPTQAAVLCPHGHWQNGNRHPTVQSRCITLARRGYVVLAPDSAHVYDDPIGLSPLGLMMWNDLRGLELLRKRPDVDPERIGCTGASGGGQQTFYLTALRSGLRAAVPAVMVCYSEEILHPRGVHCHCNFTPGLLAGTDVPMMSAAFAPRPQLFLSVTGDWTHRFPEHGFPEIRAVYALFDAAERVESRQWDCGHDYHRGMRNAMYAFFDRWLRGETAPDPELEPDGLQVEDPAVLAALDRPDLPRDQAAVKAEFRARLAAAPIDAAAADADRQLAALRQRLSTHFLEREPTVAVELLAAGGWSWRGHRVDRYALKVDREVSIPLLRIAAGGDATTVVIDSAGKADALTRRAAVVEAELAAGTSVVLADVRYTGELDRASIWRDPYGKFFGRDECVLAVQDVRRVLDALPDLTGATRAKLIGLGDHGAVAVYTAAVDDRVRALQTPELGPAYRHADRRPRAIGILRYGDLPDAALLVRRRLGAGK